MFDNTQLPIEMDMQDLEIVKKRLSEKRLTFSIAKNGDIIFETASHGIWGFLEAIEKFGELLEGASLADRVAGEAVALLCVYVKVKAVYAITLSKRAKSVFEKYAVYHEWKELVENILDANKAELCPFEKLAREISNPNRAYRKLGSLQQSLKYNKSREQFISENLQLKNIKKKLASERRKRRI